MENLKGYDKLVIFALGAIIVFSTVSAIILANIKKTDDDIIYIDDTIIGVDSENRYMTISSALDKYVYYVKYKEVEGIMSVIDTKYLETNGITYNNVLDMLESYDENYTTNIREIYQVKSYDNIYVYYLRAKLLKENMSSSKYIKDVYFKVTIDENDLTFSVAPLTENQYLEKIGDDDE